MRTTPPTPRVMIAKSTRVALAPVMPSMPSSLSCVDRGVLTGSGAATTSEPVLGAPTESAVPPVGAAAGAGVAVALVGALGVAVGAAVDVGAVVGVASGVGLA